MSCIKFPSTWCLSILSILCLSFCLLKSSRSLSHPSHCVAKRTPAAVNTLSLLTSLPTMVPFQHPAISRVFVLTSAPLLSAADPSAPPTPPPSPPFHKRGPLAVCIFVHVRGDNRPMLYECVRRPWQSPSPPHPPPLNSYNKMS